jgi:hypothetical protein
MNLLCSVTCMSAYTLITISYAQGVWTIASTVFSIEHNKDQPASDLYPNLQVIKFLEANHDPQVLNPF